MMIYDATGTCNNIFLLAGQRGWSDARLARSLGISPQAVSKWRRQAGSPSVDSLVMLADLFGVGIEELLAKTEIELELD